jgi:hypothetical protein
MKVEHEEMFRSRRLCRSARWARIGNTADAAKTAGWPAEVRRGILQAERECPAFGGGCFGVSRSSAPSTVLHSPACPTSLRIKKGPRSRMPSGGRTSGRDGRLWVGPWPKLHGIHRRRRQSRISLRRKMPPQTSTDQPMALAAPAPSHIRVGVADRHGNRGRSKSLSIPFTTMCEEGSDKWKNRTRFSFSSSQILGLTQNRLPI